MILKGFKCTTYMVGFVMSLGVGTIAGSGSGIKDHLSLSPPSSQTNIPEFCKGQAEMTWEEFRSCFGRDRWWKEGRRGEVGEKEAKRVEGEEQSRKRIFEENMSLVRKCNDRYRQGLQTYHCGVNSFSDYNHTEFVNHFTGTILGDEEGMEADTDRYTLLNVPEGIAATEIDWRSKGAVTPVKNQGACGSCWAFSSVGAVESHYQIATGALRSLSEQELVDCTSYLGNKGCGGGNIEKAYRFIINNGIDSEKDYPYSAYDGLPCDQNREKRKVAQVDSFVEVTPEDEDQLSSAVLQGPVAVAIEADHPSFRLYKGGVFDDPKCGETLDHGVLVVGFTKDAWIVKNSWGDTWGEKGYIQIKRNTGEAGKGKGMCGIAMAPAYPVVNKSAPIPIPDPTPEPPPSLRCSCKPSCDAMCRQFGYKCCSGEKGSCSCQPPRDTCCPPSKKGGGGRTYDIDMKWEHLVDMVDLE